MTHADEDSLTTQSLVRIGEGEVTKTTGSIPHKNDSFHAHKSGPLELFCRKLYHPSAKFHTIRSSFRGDTCENVFHHHYNIGVKPTGVLSTITICKKCFLSFSNIFKS